MSPTIAACGVALVSILFVGSSNAMADVRLPGEWHWPWEKHETPLQRMQRQVVEEKIRAVEPESRPQLLLPPSPPSLPLVIDTDEKATVARLLIPRQLLENLRSQVDDPEQPIVAGESRRPLAHTVAAGIALSMGLGLGGVWLVRHRGWGISRKLSAGVVALGLFGFAGAAWADVLPIPSLPSLDPARPRWRRDKPIEKPPVPTRLTLADQVTVEVVEKGDAIRLVVHPAQLPKVLKGAPK